LKKNKMRDISKTRPYHVLIAALFPLVLVSFKNYAVIKPYQLVIPFIYIALIAVVSFSIGWLFTKNKIKSFIFASFILASGFYFFPVIQYFIRLIGSEYVRDVYCFAAWALMSFAVLLWIKYKLSATVASKLTGYLNVFATVLLLINIIVVISSFAGAKPKYNPASGLQVKTISNAEKMPASSMNVYYILLDECANDATLEENFGYKNTFNNKLEALQFFVCKNARTLYGETFPSMSSTLNLVPVDDQKITQDYYTNNSVNYNYKKMGYKTKMITSFFVNNNGTCTADEVYNPYPDNIFENELVNVILANTAFRVMYKFTFFKKMVNYHADAVKATFRLADSIAMIKPESPRFLYMHVNSPHGPLCMDSTGTPDYAYVTNRNNYLHQLIYTQHATLNTVKNILQAEKGNCIILVQSDHGIRQHSSPVKLNNDADKFKVVNAFYFPEADRYTQLSDSMAIVNNFRAIFNYQFNAGFPLLQ